MLFNILDILIAVSKRLFATIQKFSPQVSYYIYNYRAAFL